MSPHSTSNANGITDNIRHIPLSYDCTDSHASASRLIFTLLPEWEGDEGEIEFIRFKDGITNTLLKACKKRPGATDEQIDKEAVLLRAYGNGTEVLIDRERETTSHFLLAQHGLAPPLLARFQNGLIYSFIQGRVCTSEDLTTEPVWRGVARRLAQWHALLPIVAFGNQAVVKNRNEISLVESPVKSTQILEKTNAIAPGKPAPNIWTVMQKWLFALPTTTKMDIQRRDRLQKELLRSASDLADTPGLGGNGLIFGHCDLLSGNVIILPQPSDLVPSSSPNETTFTKRAAETVAFIDYEYATPSPAAFDLANHFSEWGGFECDYSVLPTRSTRRAFIAEYVHTYESHRRGNPQGPSAASSSSEEAISDLFEEVDRFRGIPGLYWGMWALIQATISSIDFDYAAYAEVRLGEYFAWRGEDVGGRITGPGEKGLRERRWAEE